MPHLVGIVVFHLPAPLAPVTTTPRALSFCFTTHPSPGKVSPHKPFYSIRVTLGPCPNPLLPCGAVLTSFFPRSVPIVVSFVFNKVRLRVFFFPPPTPLLFRRAWLRHVLFFPCFVPPFVFMPDLVFVVHRPERYRGPPPFFFPLRPTCPGLFSPNETHPLLFLCCSPISLSHTLFFFACSKLKNFPHFSVLMVKWIQRTPLFFFPAPPLSFFPPFG